MASPSSTESDILIESAAVSAYRIPTATPEQDGTLDWDSTPIVVLELTAEGRTGLGFGYADLTTASLIERQLLPLIVNQRAFDIPAMHSAMRHRVRNLGGSGITAMAVSIFDIALWDLKCRILDLPMGDLFGRYQLEVPAYGSGGFTNYTDSQLAAQLEEWLELGLTRFKIKVGRDHRRDLERVRECRRVIGERMELFVDANGAYTPSVAKSCAADFSQFDVSWFEEPVSSDDLAGLRRLRDAAPTGMSIAAGEYGYTPNYFRDMLLAGAVDVLQADATRCGGMTGFLTVGAVCEAFQCPLSAHTAPTIHAPVGTACPRLIHVEYFYDHARIEEMFFDGAVQPVDGMLRPTFDRPGLGIELKRPDVAPGSNTTPSTELAR